MKWLLFISFLFSVSAIAGETSTIAPADKIAPYVRDLMESYTNSKSEEPFAVMAVMAKQADLSHISMKEPKLERGRKVYEALKAVVDSSKKGMSSILKTKGLEYQQFYIRNMVSIENATPELVNQLAENPEVIKIVGNPIIKNGLNSFEGSEKIFGASKIEGNITSVGAPEVWNQFGVKGKGVVVAGQDTGYQWDHPGLKKKYRGYISENEVDHTYSWHDAIHKRIMWAAHNKCGYNKSTPCDDSQHGTHTMGTILGDDGRGNQVGVAPEAQWIGCRNMDQGAGQPATYIECFEFFLAPYPQGGVPWKDGRPELAPHVINNSWGCPASEGCDGSEMVAVLDVLYKAGIMVVVSAGNDGPGCSSVQNQPAGISATTFSVGAHDYRNGKIAYFSSRGPSKLDQKLGPDVSAPGVNIRSTAPTSTYAGGWNGTSMAGPHVVGQVALMMSANNRLIGDVDRVSEIIRSTATRVSVKASKACGGPLDSPNNVYGYGRIDALSSVKAALQVR